MPVEMKTVLNTPPLIAKVQPKNLADLDGLGRDGRVEKGDNQRQQRMNANHTPREPLALFMYSCRGAVLSSLRRLTFWGPNTGVGTTVIAAGQGGQASRQTHVQYAWPRLPPCKIDTVATIAIPRGTCAQRVKTCAPRAHPKYENVSLVLLNEKPEPYVERKTTALCL